MLRIYAKSLVLPPVSNFLLLILALLMWRRRPVLAFGLILLSMGSLYAFSTQRVASLLMESIQTDPALQMHEIAPFNAQAIVVLGSGREHGAPEYGFRDTVSSYGLVRLRYAARLARASKLPVLVTGGSPYLNDAVPEAEMMAGVLADEFGVPVQWQESGSRTTWENAQFSGDLLLPEGVQRIVLVSHAWHLPRASAFFRKRGFDVLPAPTDFYDRAFPDDPVMEWMPQAEALRFSYHALHEHLGLLWYRVSGQI